VGAGDVIYSDALSHASLIDGCRLSKATIRIFPHGDLDELAAMMDVDRHLHRRALIVVEGVFSMDGDVFPLDHLVPLAKRFDAWTYVDDAHGTGVLGATGAGTVERMGVTGQIDVVVGTLGKALGTSGAYVAGSHVLIEYLISRARSFIFTTGTPPAIAAATLEALRLVELEGWRRDAVRERARRLRTRLRDFGREAPGAADIGLDADERNIGAGWRGQLAAEGGHRSAERKLDLGADAGGHRGLRGGAVIDQTQRHLARKAPARALGDQGVQQVGGVAVAAGTGLTIGPTPAVARSS
jgi:hypothetical protein